jgi:hypothetical protein
MSTANEYMASFKTRHAVPKKRVNWKLELRKERERVLSEVIEALRNHQRTIPKEWERGYNSAVSQVEILK